jgi:hypothetical protein
VLASPIPDNCVMISFSESRLIFVRLIQTELLFSEHSENITSNCLQDLHLVHWDDHIVIGFQSIYMTHVYVVSYLTLLIFVKFWISACDEVYLIQLYDINLSDCCDTLFHSSHHKSTVKPVFDQF